MNIMSKLAPPYPRCLQREHVLPSGGIVKLNRERGLCTEVLLNPQTDRPDRSCLSGEGLVYITCTRIQEVQDSGGAGVVDWLKVAVDPNVNKRCARGTYLII